MAVRHQLVEYPPEQVWQVLAEPERYADWVVGVSGSEPRGNAWPQVGASLTYTLSLGPWTGKGRTVVRRSQRPRFLELEADSGPFGSARIAIEVRAWGDTESLVIVDEHPLRGTAARLHNVVLDVLLQWRHRRMLGLLAKAVEETAQDEGGLPAPWPT
ncbi:SRPBCC family protein [Streptomyces sp. NPDC051976]|uniref:SRPBCC family protein n=1 Tax=Streptomyces sp. NPDC051976 TaxID=3154947 RepID=UPI00344AADBF